MKFIREIITGKGDAGPARPRDDAAASREPPRAPVLDLEAFSVPPDAPAPLEPPQSPPAAPRSWARSQNGALLSRNLASAIRQPEKDAAGGDGPGGAALSDAAPAGDLPDDQDQDQDLTGIAVREILAEAPRAPADLPGFRHRQRPGADPAPRLAGVTPLRAPLDDPFQRLERLSHRNPPPAEAPSPFERQRDRRPATEAPQPRARPRTRLAPDLMASMGAPSSPGPSPEPGPDPRPDPIDDAVAMPAPAAGRAARRAGRVKTRLLGFNGGGDANPFDAATGPAATAAPVLCPVGWLVVAAGPGRGHAFALFAGVSQIGRGQDQAVRLDFGDTAISRQNHAAIAYDREQGKFYLGHGGKANLVRLNGRPVLSTEEMATGSRIRIGETTLHFVALCGTGFDWDTNHDDDGDGDATA